MNEIKMWTTHVDPNVLADYKKRQLLKSQSHSRLPLQIWNYAPACQYSKDKWDEVTTLCRGLIVDTDTNEIVGRSFRKFWNEGEKLYTPTETFTVWEKMDGSLGILFHYKGQWIITSRGSFVSDQAMKAQEMLSTKYDISGFDKETSYVFEIVYPENRIVIDYGKTEALYFLAAFKRSGEEIFPPPVKQIQAAGFPICPSYPEFNDFKQLHSLDWANHEGFVIRFSTGERMKIKFENYLQLHRMATNMSTASVYEHFCEKKPLADLLELAPNEFHDWIKTTWDSLQTAYDELLKSLTSIVESHAHLAQRDFALAIAANPMRGALFAIRAGKDAFQLLCKEIKPKEDEKLQWGPIPVITAPTKTKSTITILVGISGSGKSTYASKLLNTNPNLVVVSRDKIREQIFGYEPEEIGKYYESSNFSQKEELVTQTQYAQMDAALAGGYDVLVDTNLTQKTIRALFSRFPDASFAYHVCECDMDDAILRCAERRRKVSGDVIRSQASKLVVLKPYLEELFSKQSAIEPIVQDKTKPPAVIIDLDGTLALHTGRNVYDWSRVEEDALNRPVTLTLNALHEKGYAIILCSGRDEEARDGTERWLLSHTIPYQSLHLRPRGDSRPDYEVKEEMWREIVKNNYIEYMLDDRNSVVNHARRLGFTVFQVAPGNF
jgi:RNA ligase